MGGVERARQRVALHGGEVGATSELGVGTTLRLSFPLEGAAPTAPIAGSAAQGAP